MILPQGDFCINFIQKPLNREESNQTRIEEDEREVGGSEATLLTG